jgi:hypothetical protein
MLLSHNRRPIRRSDGRGRKDNAGGLMIKFLRGKLCAREFDEGWQKGYDAGHRAAFHELGYAVKRASAKFLEEASLGPVEARRFLAITNKMVNLLSGV